MNRLNRRGQSTGEYAILFAIVLGAVIGVQNLVRNEIAGELKQRAENYSTAPTVTITRSSDSLSASRTKMTDASSGSARSDSQSSQIVTNP